jgi:hypothetical protein
MACGRTRTVFITGSLARLIVPALLIILSQICPSPLLAADDYRNLPDNPGLRLPFSAADAPRIRVEEAMHYRHPRDYSNHAADPGYRQFRDDCGEDGECVKHFADFDRAGAPHRAMDYVDVTGNVFDVYAGVAGRVERIDRIPDQPWFTSVTVSAKIRRRLYRVIFTHIDPDTLRLREGDMVGTDTRIGRTYANRGTVWNLDGVGVSGYCRPDDRPHPFPDHPEKRCYPSHLDYQVKEVMETYVAAVDPYEICRYPNEGNYNGCKAYGYPGNRFGTPAGPLGSGHLWELAAGSATIMLAVPTTSPLPGDCNAIAAVLLPSTGPSADPEICTLPLNGNLCQQRCIPLYAGHSS